jgi:hypothetical protein
MVPDGRSKRSRKILGPYLKVDVTTIFFGFDPMVGVPEG